MVSSNVDRFHGAVYAPKNDNAFLAMSLRRACITGRRKHRDHLPAEVPPEGLPVQTQKHRVGIHIVHSQPLETRQIITVNCGVRGKSHTAHHAKLASVFSAMR
jgi:hypothetical protein